MIRVLLRHVDAEEGALIGDFAPSEIDALLDRIRVDRVYYDDEAEDCVLFDGEDGPLQWILTDEVRPRAVLEIIVETS